MTSLGTFGLFNLISFSILGVYYYFREDTFINAITVSIYIFLLMLPMLNGILDFISFSVSRYLSKKIATDKSIFLIILHLFLDLILAVVFFMFLLNLIYSAIDGLNTFGNVNIQVPTKEVFTSVLHDPFAIDNLWFTSMFITTLIPTVAHFIFAVIALILYFTKLVSWYSVQIKQISDGTESMRIKLAALLALPTTIILLFFGYLVLYLPFLKFTTWISL